MLAEPARVIQADPPQRRVPVGLFPGRDGNRLQPAGLAGEAGEQPGLAAPLGDRVAQTGEAGPGDRRERLGEPVVKAQPGPGGRACSRRGPVVAEGRRAGRQLGVTGQEVAALSAGDELAVLEGKAAGLPEGSGQAAPVAAALGLARVLDHHQVVRACSAQQSVHVPGAAGEVDWQDRPRPARNLGGQVAQVDGLAVSASVDQDGAGADGDDRGDGHDDRDGGNQHLVAWSGAASGERGVQGGGPGGHRYGVPGLRSPLQFGLQGADLAVGGGVGHLVQDIADHAQRRAGGGKPVHDAARVGGKEPAEVHQRPHVDAVDGEQVAVGARWRAGEQDLGVGALDGGTACGRSGGDPQRGRAVPQRSVRLDEGQRAPAETAAHGRDRHGDRPADLGGVGGGGQGQRKAGTGRAG